jgi:hypothetical protein
MTGAIIRYGSSVDGASTCWSGTASAVVAVASVRRWWSIIATGATGRILLVTLCIRCHIRIHHSSGLRYWFSGMLLRLWREFHPTDPMQLQLSFQNAEKKEKLKNVLEQVSGKVLPLLALPNTQAPELIGALADPEKSRTSSDSSG